MVTRLYIGLIMVISRPVWFTLVPSKAYKFTGKSKKDPFKGIFRRGLFPMLSFLCLTSLPPILSH